jgi:hypothetical protein
VNVTDVDRRVGYRIGLCSETLVDLVLGSIAKQLEGQLLNMVILGLQRDV